MDYPSNRENNSPPSSKNIMQTNVLFQNVLFLTSCSLLFLFFQNKNQFLNKIHVFVRECLVSVIENKFHVFKNKKKGTKLVLILPCSCLFRTKTNF